MSIPYTVSIDSELCTGHGRCVELAGRVFRFDDDGFGQVRADAEYPELAVIERVAALCPELAVKVERLP